MPAGESVFVGTHRRHFLEATMIIGKRVSADVWLRPFPYFFYLRAPPIRSPNRKTSNRDPRQSRKKACLGRLKGASSCVSMKFVVPFVLVAIPDVVVFQPVGVPVNTTRAREPDE